MSKSKSKIFRIFLFTLVAIFAIGVFAAFAACGGGEPDDDEPDGSTPTATYVSATLSAENVLVDSGIESVGNLPATVTMTLASDGSVSLSVDIYGTVTPYTATYTIVGNDFTLQISDYDADAGTVTWASDGSVSSIAMTSFTGLAQTFTFTVVAGGEPTVTSVSATLKGDAEIDTGYNFSLTGSVVLTLNEDGSAKIVATLMTVEYPYDCTYSMEGNTITLQIADYDADTGTITWADDGSVASITFTSFTGVAQSAVFTAVSEETGDSWSYTYEGYDSTTTTLTVNSDGTFKAGSSDGYWGYLDDTLTFVKKNTITSAFNNCTYTQGTLVDVEGGTVLAICGTTSSTINTYLITDISVITGDGTDFTTLTNWGGDLYQTPYGA